MRMSGYDPKRHNKRRVTA
ncbi:hypothetical protein Gotri_014166 [Gossypium trilobum]|uniref:Uncharacterized protein n=1 Tax=Gossypium trilobum TaxID=34281 RepID=A0A7J9DWI2_9ROSI|nr:hypothetical protein [Gossypium trilobum]